MNIALIISALILLLIGVPLNISMGNWIWAAYHLIIGLTIFVFLKVIK